LTKDLSASTFTTPKTNEPYSMVSGDFNPYVLQCYRSDDTHSSPSPFRSIHINPYFSDLAVLPGTITHGLWSSAATRKYVETIAADNHPDRVVS
jgi:fatty acid synthase subunit beta